MRKKFISIFLQVGLLAALALTCPNASPAHEQSIAGAQISVLEGDSWESCAALFKGLKKLGYNTVILRVFHNSGDRFHNLVADSRKEQLQEGVYFNTDQAPVISDILKPACKHAHRAGLKIFAWMTTLKANYARNSRPQVLSFDKTQNKFVRESNLLDPKAPENIVFLKKIFKDLATYPIDGILLQDDLMLRHNQGFNLTKGVITPKVEDVYSTAAAIKPYRPPFYNWRRQQALELQSLANQLFAACRELKPHIICTQNIHYELLYNPEWGRDWFASTLESMASSSADQLMIMAYQERIKRELNLTSEELYPVMLKLFKNGILNDRKRIIFKFETPDQQASQKKQGAAIKTLKKTIENVRRCGWTDIVLTPCNNLEAAKCLPGQ